MVKHAELTVAEYLVHMGKAVVEANITSMQTLSESLAEDQLDAQIPIGGVVVDMDGTVIVPEGWFTLDEMVIECESAVHVARDEEGTPTGLAMSMSKGLFKRGMHVKFKATFRRTGQVEGIEILRQAGNEALNRAIKGTNLSVKINTREASNG